MQMSKLQAELVYNDTLLGVSTAAAAEPENAKLQDPSSPNPKIASPANSLARMLFTEGTAKEPADGAKFYSSKDIRMRAKALETTPSRLEIIFTYEGKTKTTKTLASGQSRAQLGCYLAAKNQCNLLYAMWRIEPAPGIVVQKKSNPQMSTHQECKNGGYASVKPSYQKKINAPELNRSYKLLCELEQNVLTVKVDNEKVWSGTVDLESLDTKGYAGVRSDNVQWQFAVTKEALHY